MIEASQPSTAPACPESAPDRSASHERHGLGAWRPSPVWIPLAVLVLGLIVTGILAWAARVAYLNNEKRLLALRVREAGSVLTEALPGIETPLASGSELARATNGDAAKFKQFMATYVGAAPTHPFVSASLWRRDAIRRGPVTSLGVAPTLRASSATAQAFFNQTARTGRLGVIGMLAQPDRRIGYAFAAPGGYVAYAEGALPPKRRARIQSNSAFSDLNYAIYLGDSQRPRDLLVTSVSRLPLEGTTATRRIPFGNSAFTLVMTPRRPLGGRLPQVLPWIIAIAGLLLSGGAAALTFGLTRRRQAAERLAERLERVAAENRRLYAEQRNIARTLQHALLPYELPELRGAEAVARFQPGERGVEIGGDWYDVIVLDDDRVLFVVGDVSGRGVRAAATMASLRFAIHAYAAQGDPPPTILTKLSTLVSIGSGGRLATVLCALVDVDRRELTVTSAGHLPPLLIADGQAGYLESSVGLPVGVDPSATYSSSTVTAPPRATFLAFTDGLIERRGEDLDDGLTRLRDEAAGDAADLPALLSRLLLHAPSEDDTAILGVRWTQ